MVNFLHVRRALLLFAAIAAFVVFLPDIAWAQTDSVEEVGTAAGFGSAGLMEIIGTIISVVLGLLGVVFLILLIASGVVWMTAGGSEEKIKKAQKLLINAVVGLVIVLTSYGIASFILNAFGDATGWGTDSSNGTVTVEPRSGSLGSGSIRDHYPERNASDVARNTRVMVTFSEAMDIESFITGYDTNGTAEDTSDDTVATAIRSEYVQIYPTEDESAVLTDVTVTFTDDLKTFVFDPADYLGSASEDTSYTVSLSTNITDADGDDAFTGLYDGGYEWSFEVGTTIDLDPPSVRSVSPVAGRSYDRNIVVEISFDEAIDPTSATGTRLAGSGFQNIQTVDATSGAPAEGTYEISNGYRTITFTPSSACSEDGSVVTNSCGETMYCLPGGENMTVTASAAAAVNDPPQADSFPYDGVVDTAANSLDGNDDGTAGDDYAWSFTTTDDINLEGATIESISPSILGTDLALDQEIVITFDDMMRESTLTSSNITLENYEQSAGTAHEMWYLPRAISLDIAGAEVTADSQTPVQTQVSIDHGVFLESEGELTYLYGVLVGEGVQNQYQNCYSPAEGPDENGTACGVGDASPSCCNGEAQSETCDFFPDPSS